jgi:hypothetical protein
MGIKMALVLLSSCWKSIAGGVKSKNSNGKVSGETLREKMVPPKVLRNLLKTTFSKIKQNEDCFG